MALARTENIIQAYVIKPRNIQIMVDKLAYTNCSQRIKISGFDLIIAYKDEKSTFKVYTIGIIIIECYIPN